MATALPACRCSRKEDVPEPTSPEQVDREPPTPEYSGFPPPTSEPTVRVRVRTWRAGDEPTTAGSEGQWLRLTFDDRTGRGVALRAPVAIARQDGRWSIIDGAGGAPRVYEAPAIIASTLNAEDRTIALNGRSDGASGVRRFGGELNFVALPEREPRAFDVVNHLPMEQYLPGVLARELFPHWAAATFAAQAVAARSFAAHEHLHFESRRHYDVTDTVSSQAYVGDVDLAVAHQAVAHTGGQVLAYDDVLVPGYYCSCCGGTSAPATEAIGPNPVNALPPLNGRSDPDACTDAPLYRWRIERPLDLLSRRMAAYGQFARIPALADLTRLRSISMERSTAGGRPLTYRVTGDGAAALVLDAQRLRSAANFYNRDLPQPEQMLWSSFIEVSVHDDVVVIDGRGHGHGVGLCQYGAESLARSGSGYLDILRRYYPGAMVVQAYDPAQRQRSLLG